MKNRQQSHLHQQHILKLPGSGRIWWGIGLTTFFVMAIMVFFAGEKSLFKVMSLYQERDHLAVRTTSIKQENKKMLEQIEQLKSNPKAVEQIAREELGMVRPDEIVYRFVPSEARPIKTKD